MNNKYNPDLHHRRSIRLREYDYSQAGVYFLTICTREKECMLGEIDNGKMELNEYGAIIKNEWMKTQKVRKNIELDEFIIMPNHIHGIVIINTDFNVGAIRWVARIRKTENGANQNRAIHRIAPTTTLRPNSIGSIIGQFKSITTKQINQIRNTPGIPIWQRNYYEHIIRNESELNHIREYIINNPLKWDEDEDNPLNIKMH